MKIFTADSVSEFTQRVEDGDYEISKAIYDGIKHGVKRKRKAVVVFSFNLTGKADVYDFTIDRSQWSTALNTCMNIFAKHDMFEECIEIQNLLKELKA
jgi:hypothetical protein